MIGSSMKNLGIFHNVGNGRRMFPLEALATGAESCGWEAEMVPLGSDTVENYDMVAVGGAPWKYRCENLRVTLEAQKRKIPYLYIECGWLYKPPEAPPLLRLRQLVPVLPKIPMPPRSS